MGFHNLSFKVTGQASARQKAKIRCYSIMALGTSRYHSLVQFQPIFLTMNRESMLRVGTNFYHMPEEDNIGARGVR